MAMLCILPAYAQHTLSVVVKNKETKPLPGAVLTIASLKKSAVADSNGVAIMKDMVPGAYEIRITHIGYEDAMIKLVIPLTNAAEWVVELEELAEESEEVVVTSTRVSRTIANIATRVETISREELEEKGNMKPGDIRMLLNESTGIQTQQTSATSYNSSIRIQGLDGRYTQLLRDGMPLYSGFSGGLSLLQIAPLDLKQVEVIKGSSSTLYGGGAIAGLVNLVSKTPGNKRELSFIANATSAKGLDLSSFYSERFKKIGITVFGSANSAAAYDPAGIGLTAIPAYERYTINPRLFIYGNKTNANIGISYVTENRLGGSMNYIKNGTAGYFEKNNTDRITTQVDIRHEISANTAVSFKSSYTTFKRLIGVPSYVFEATQQSSYSEINLATKTETASWIFGANFLTDDINETLRSATTPRDYHYNTFGMFIQHTWSPTGNFSLETGLRGDYVKQYGLELLPRIAAMYKASRTVTIRLGGGLGYKTPTLFNEEAERIQFQQVLPIDQQTVRNEKSIGGSMDVNYRVKMGEIGIAVNQLLFYTRLNKPLLLTASGTNYVFLNAAGFIDTKGIETNLRLTYSDFKLFIGYTYADVNSYAGNIKNWFPLTARHRLNNVLMYEKEGVCKIGLEAYYFSPQKLSDGTTGKPYWIFGIMGEKFWKQFSLFLNFENFTDTRQTRFDAIYTGSITNPVFRDIYAPVDGFVVNGGIKWRL